MVRAEALSAPAAEHCRNCGSELGEDQEWCLECGAARTLLRRPPDWRLSLAVVAAVVVVGVAGVVVALVILAS